VGCNCHQRYAMTHGFVPALASVSSEQWPRSAPSVAHCIRLTLTPSGQADMQPGHDGHDGQDGQEAQRTGPTRCTSLASLLTDPYTTLATMLKPGARVALWQCLMSSTDATRSTTINELAGHGHYSRRRRPVWRIMGPRHQSGQSPQSTHATWRDQRDQRASVRRVADGAARGS
jgi:hypothetical protein